MIYYSMQEFEKAIFPKLYERIQREKESSKEAGKRCAKESLEKIFGERKPELL